LISGDSTTGAWTARDISTQFLKSWIELGTAPDSNREVLLTPVDYVSRAICTLVGRSGCFGEVFHLVSSERVSLKALADMIRAGGLPLATVPYEKWSARVKEHAVRSPGHWMAGIVPFLGQAGGAEDGLRLWPPSGMRYGSAKTVEHLGYCCPEISQEQVTRNLEFLTRSGLIAATH
jgi:hypothetical protein